MLAADLCLRARGVGDAVGDVFVNSVNLSRVVPGACSDVATAAARQLERIVTLTTIGAGQHTGL